MAFSDVWVWGTSQDPRDDLGALALASQYIAGNFTFNGLV